MKATGNKKLIISVSLVIISVLVLLSWAFLFSLFLYAIYSGGPATQDWTDDSLPGRYEVSKINDIDIKLIKEVENKESGILFQETVIGRYVVGYCYNDVYIGVMQLPRSSDYDEPREDFSNYNENEVDYYLVDSVSEQVYGPYDFEQFNSEINQKQITMGNWIYSSEYKY